MSEQREDCRPVQEVLEEARRNGTLESEEMRNLRACLKTHSVGQYDPEGRKHGPHTEYWDDWTKKCDGNWIHGKEEGEHRIYYRGEPQPLCQIKRYSHGMLHGDQEAWYEDGKKEHYLSYLFGKKDGLHAFWFKNGKERLRLRYAKDVLHGSFTSWHLSGRLRSKGINKNGQYTGLCIRWSQDGQSRSKWCKDHWEEDKWCSETKS